MSNPPFNPFMVPRGGNLSQQSGPFSVPDGAFSQGGGGSMSSDSEYGYQDGDKVTLWVRNIIRFGETTDKFVYIPLEVYNFMKELNFTYFDEYISFMEAQRGPVPKYYVFPKSGGQVERMQFFYNFNGVYRYHATGKHVLMPSDIGELGNPDLKLSTINYTMVNSHQIMNGFVANDLNLSVKSSEIQRRRELGHPINQEDSEFYSTVYPFYIDLKFNAQGGMDVTNFSESFEEFLILRGDSAKFVNKGFLFHNARIESDLYELIDDKGPSELQEELLAFNHELFLGIDTTPKFKMAFELFIPPKFKKTFGYYIPVDFIETLLRKLPSFRNNDELKEFLKQNGVPYYLFNIHKKGPLNFEDFWNHDPFEPLYNQFDNCLAVIDPFIPNEVYYFIYITKVRQRGTDDASETSEFIILEQMNGAPELNEKHSTLLTHSERIILGQDFFRGDDEEQNKQGFIERLKSIFPFWVKVNKTTGRNESTPSKKYLYVGNSFGSFDKDSYLVEFGKSKLKSLLKKVLGEIKYLKI